jgi:capsular polysaccharide export protein
MSPHEIDDVSLRRIVGAHVPADPLVTPIRRPVPLIGILKPTILRIPNLELFLQPWGRPVDFFQMRARQGELSAIAGWGFKPTAEKARAEAARRGLPYLAIEDGFLRSIRLGVAGAPPWSLIVDDVGAHYDAKSESRLERLIACQKAGDPDTHELMRLMRRYGLSKYNDAPDIAVQTLPRDRPLVIVLDQTSGDMSVPAGGGGPESFLQMLDAALAENPGCRVLVRTHPDVLSGRRHGFLTDEARRRGVPLLSVAAGWPSIARYAARVYSVTSLGGLEAVIAGVPVSCFAMPFYAGWGLTEDRVQCARRQARPSLAALVSAIYQRYPGYVDPIHGGRCEALILARRLAAARSAVAEGRIAAIAERRPVAGRVLGWIGSRRTARTREAFASLFAACLPLGLNTSLGLRILEDTDTWRDLAAPPAWDRRPSDAGGELMERARALQRRLRELWLLAGALETQSEGSSPARCLLVIGSAAEAQDLPILECLRSTRPGARLIYLPHLAKRARNSVGRGVETVTESTPALLQASEVHTADSPIGFVALLLGRRVVTYGYPFYGGLGLTEDRKTWPVARLARSLEEVVAMTLLASTTYIHCETGLPIDAVDAVDIAERKLRQRRQPPRVDWRAPAQRFEES